MHQQMSRVAVSPGGDMVCRAGQVVFLGRSAGPSEQVVLESLVAIVQGGGAGADGDVVRAVAGATVGAPAAKLPSFAMLAPTRDGLTVLLQRDALATWRADDREGRLSGTEASTFVERLLPPEVTTVDLSFPGSGTPDDLSNLVGGVVRGSGVRVHLAAGADRVSSDLVADPTEPEPPTAPVQPAPASPESPVEEERTAHRPIAETAPSPSVLDGGSYATVRDLRPGTDGSGPRPSRFGGWAFGCASHETRGHGGRHSLLPWALQQPACALLQHLRHRHGPSDPPTGSRRTTATRCPGHRRRLGLPGRR